MNEFWRFPFGEPVQRVVQRDRAPKDVFVLGVYASAVHARWIDSSGEELAKALAVASEPYIFWRGENAEQVVARIAIPAAAGRLEAAASFYNGPSGITLDRCILAPLGVTRERAWLADLVPHSCANPEQQAALRRCYLPRISKFGLPSPSVPPVPANLATTARQEEIAAELAESKAQVVVLLGDEPIRWFSSRWCPSRQRLSDFGTDPCTYGRLHPARIGGSPVGLLPLAHPRQVARLGRSSVRWFDLHSHWMATSAAGVLS